MLRHCTLIAVIVVLAGCKLKAEDMEGAMREEFTKQGIEVKDLECPGDRTMKEGDEFDCTGKSVAGDEFKVHVKQTEGGGYKWDLVGRTFDLEQYAADVGSKLSIKMDCGKGKIIAVKGTKFTCKWDEKSADILVTDDEGTLNADDFASKYSGPK